MRFEINQTVKITDPNNFYFGRVGKIAERVHYAGDDPIYTVHVPSATGNAIISTAVLEHRLEAA